MIYPALQLKPREQRWLARGHLWVYSNQVQAPVPDLEPGSLVRVVDQGGICWGVATYNRHALIMARLLAHRDQPVDNTLIRDRLREAVAYRTRINRTQRNAARWVFSEGDRLPGLIVDRYAEVSVLQLATAGMEQFREVICATIAEYPEIKCLVERNDFEARAWEKLPLQQGVIFGLAPDLVEIAFAYPGGNAISTRRCFVDVLEGHKTGFYLDQAENVGLLQTIAPGARVLDLCAFTGAWAVAAGLWGAQSVLAIESSQPAAALCRRNADLNGCANLEVRTANIFEELPRLVHEGRRFDVVVLDPPSLVKGAKHLETGLAAYKRLNHLALEVLAPGGRLITCACSHAVTAEHLRETLVLAAKQANRHLRLVQTFTQALDHPILLGMAETQYLNGLLMQDVGT